MLQQAEALRNPERRSFMTASATLGGADGRGIGSVASRLVPSRKPSDSRSAPAGGVTARCTVALR